MSKKPSKDDVHRMVGRRSGGRPCMLGHKAMEPVVARLRQLIAAADEHGVPVSFWNVQQTLEHEFPQLANQLPLDARSYRRFARNNLGWRG